jgi:hypothetical protein
MAKKNDILDGLTPEQQQAEIDHARKVLASASNFVIDAVEASRERLYAMAYVLLNALEPDDKKNPPDDHPLIAWRLAQVLVDLLSDTDDVDLARDFLLGEGG